MIVNLKTIEIRSITLKRCPLLGCAKIDNWRAAIAPTSASGTNRTSRAGRAMSVDWGKPEVTDRRSKRRD
jgi:hypothetical protein